MQTTTILASLFFAVSASVATAQTSMTTSGGATGSIPVFTGPSNVEGSVIIQTSGGNVGIGTTTPQGLLDIQTTYSQGGFVVSGANLDPGAFYSLSPLANSGKLLEGWNRTGGQGEIDLISNRSAGSMGGFAFYDYSNSGALTSLMSLSGTGNMSVAGNITLSSGSGASIVFQDGTIQSTAWTGTLCGGDYAESVEVSDDRTHYEPGDLIVIDPNNPGKFLKSKEPYSTLVSGIYSTKPGLVGRRQLTDKSHMQEEVPMAMTGIVPTKVSAENGPIKVGDLLVTSSTIGYAMKGTSRELLTGAVVGKSLGNLPAGKGVIEVLVTLQ